LIYSIPGFADPFSSLSHLIGAAVFAVLAAVLLRRAYGFPGRMALLGVFGFASVFLLSMSGVYHLLPRGFTSRKVMQCLDHAGIFVMIAASFTPPHGILFRGVQRWGPILLVWTLAAAGITFRAIYFQPVPHWLAILVYLGFGWIGAFSGIALWRRYGRRFIHPILLGGMAYTLGALVDLVEPPELIPGVVGPHEIFHMAVLLGVGAHWWFMYRIADLGLDVTPVSGRQLTPCLASSLE
jgi:channel protein (hemolysin III family)